MYFLDDFFLLCADSASAAPTSGYFSVTADRKDDSDACVDGGDMSPAALVSPCNPDTFGTSSAASVFLDVDATAFACMFAYLDRMGLACAALLF